MHGTILLLALTAPASPPETATYRSPHFIVEAPTAETAARVARAAERQLKDIARQWLGRELPDWAEPCPITVDLEDNHSRGHSNFVYHEGRVLRQAVHVGGTLERVLNGVLPHEITHVVLMQHFRRQVPRWADEGGASLTEGAAELARYRGQMQQLLATPGRCMPLRDLFAQADYPHDLRAFYDEGISVSAYLIGLRDRPTFVAFVAMGMDVDWDAALRKHYGFRSIEALEDAWLDRLRQDHARERTADARREQLPAPAARPVRVEAIPTGRTVTR